jgi:hypothetical protein
MLSNTCGSRKGFLPECGQTQPQKEDKLEGEVKGEPVDNVHQRLNDGEEGKDDPVLEILVLASRFWQFYNHMPQRA